MSISTTSNSEPLMLDQLELGVTGTIEVMICRMWDVNSATGRDNNRGSRAAALFNNLEEGGSRDIVDDDHENDESLNSLQDQVVFLKR
ncbi:hypothetical protein Tco_0898037, partial [Tanacetum coccineum]